LQSWLKVCNGWSLVMDLMNKPHMVL